MAIQSLFPLTGSSEEKLPDAPLLPKPDVSVVNKARPSDRVDGELNKPSLENAMRSIASAHFTEATFLIFCKLQVHNWKGLNPLGCDDIELNPFFPVGRFFQKDR